MIALRHPKIHFECKMNDWSALALEIEFSASEFVMSQNKSTKLDSTAENMAA